MFKNFLKMLFSFAPWISFLIIAHDSMFRLKLGLIVAAVLTLVMAITKLHRGVIMWVGLVFFTYALIAVIGMNHMWTVRYMGALANGALALGTWIGIALKSPFTIEYAREHVDPALWNHPAFLRTNYLMTGMWGSVFTISTLLALQRSMHPSMPAWAYEAITYTLLVSAMFFSTWYPEYAKQRRAAAADATA